LLITYVFLCTISLSIIF